MDVTMGCGGDFIPIWDPQHSSFGAPMLPSDPAASRVSLHAVVAGALVLDFVEGVPGPGRGNYRRVKPLDLVRSGLDDDSVAWSTRRAQRHTQHACGTPVLVAREKPRGTSAQRQHPSVASMSK
jgi:hypothetical protein